MPEITLETQNPFGCLESDFKRNKIYLCEKPHIIPVVYTEILFKYLSIKLNAILIALSFAVFKHRTWQKLLLKLKYFKIGSKNVYNYVLQTLY